MSKATALPAVPAGKADKAIREGLSWEADRQARIARSERRAWQVAGAACLVALAAVGALVGLMPLKATVPYLVYVDKTSGNTEIVNALNVRDIGYRELNDKYWTSRYVVARESYFYTLLQYDYDTVLALSNDDVGRVYAKQFEGDGAKDKRLGASLEERVRVISVTLPPDQHGKAVIRFEKLTRLRDNDSGAAPKTYVATLAFTYRPSMRGSEKDLLQNPLGFKVTSYRVDAELGRPGGAS